MGGAPNPTPLHPESVISFSGGRAHVVPTVVPKYGEINKLLKLKSRLPLRPSAPPAPSAAPPPPPPPPSPLSAGIKDPHKFHSARPSTLAQKSESESAPGTLLHPRRRNAHGRARAASRRAGSRHSGLGEISREEAKLRSPSPPRSLPLAHSPGCPLSFLFLSLPLFLAHFLPPPSTRHLPVSPVRRHSETPEIYARLISAIT
jgi:hypothetical protein